MTVEDIINKAWHEKHYWQQREYREGKFIIGIEVRDILLAHADYVNTGKIDTNTFMGFYYVVDYQNPEAVEFCPKTDL